MTSARLPGPPPVGTAVLVIGGPISPGDVAGLCERARVLWVRTGADVVDCDVQALVRPDAVTVEALARLQLTARRLGRRVRIRHASGELRQLLALVGLTDVVVLAPAHHCGSRGSPKSGNSVAVSRKKVSSTIRPSDTSST